MKIGIRLFLILILSALVCNAEEKRETTNRFDSYYSQNIIVESDYGKNVSVELLAHSSGYDFFEHWRQAILAAQEQCPEKQKYMLNSVWLVVKKMLVPHFRKNIMPSEKIVLSAEFSDSDEFTANIKAGTVSVKIKGLGKFEEFKPISCFGQAEVLVGDSLSAYDFNTIEKRNGTMVAELSKNLDLSAKPKMVSNK